MKKKGILIFVVLLLSMSAIFFAKEMQKKLVNSQVAKGTETKVLQSNQKENSNNDSKKDDKEEVKNTGKADNNSEIKEEPKESAKTQDNNSSSKNTANGEISKQSTEKSSASANTSINKSSGTSGSTSSNNIQNSNSSTQQNQNNSLPPNFIVRDTVHDKLIVSKHIDFNGETVASITRKNIACNESMPGYFNIIAGLKAQDRNVGPYSGWCYYINGSKPSIGAGDYIPKKDDVVEWKYLKDGVNN